MERNAREIIKDIAKYIVETYEDNLTDVGKILYGYANDYIDKSTEPMTTSAVAVNVVDRYAKEHPEDKRESINGYIDWVKYHITYELCYLIDTKVKQKNLEWQKKYIKYK